MSQPSLGAPPSAPVAQSLFGRLAAVIRRYVPAGYVISLIRTWVPVGIGAVLAYVAVHWHILLPNRMSNGVTLVAGAVAIALYYALSRAVERRWPRVGRWLLSAGLIEHQPVYLTRDVVADVLGAGRLLSGVVPAAAVKSTPPVLSAVKPTSTPPTPPGPPVPPSAT